MSRSAIAPRIDNALGLEVVRLIAVKAHIVIQATHMAIPDMDYMDSATQSHSWVGLRRNYTR